MICQGTPAWWAQVDVEMDRDFLSYSVSSKALHKDGSQVYLESYKVRVLSLRHAK